MFLLCLGVLYHGRIDSGAVLTVSSIVDGLIAGLFLLCPTVSYIMGGLIAGLFLRCLGVHYRGQVDSRSVPTVSGCPLSWAD
jgi:hypothetical protein